MDKIRLDYEFGEIKDTKEEAAAKQKARLDAYSKMLNQEKERPSDAKSE